MNKNLYNTMFKSHREFANMICTGDETKDEWAHRETREWFVRMKKLSEIEANELVYDVSTGKCLGTRQQVEARNA